MEAIISACVVGGLSLIGVIITNIGSSKSIENKLATSQAVTDTKLNLLTEEVKKHNSFAERIPVLESEVKQLKETMKEVRSA